MEQVLSKFRCRIPSSKIPWKDTIYIYDARSLFSYLSSPPLLLPVATDSLSGFVNTVFAAFPFLSSLPPHSLHFILTQPFPFSRASYFSPFFSFRAFHIIESYVSQSSYRGIEVLGERRSIGWMAIVPRSYDDEAHRVTCCHVIHVVHVHRVS